MKMRGITHDRSILWGKSSLVSIPSYKLRIHDENIVA